MEYWRCLFPSDQKDQEALWAVFNCPFDTRNPTFICRTFKNNGRHDLLSRQISRFVMTSEKLPLETPAKSPFQ